jgi:AbrB family looped-hinge helix DNA binding protein
MKILQSFTNTNSKGQLVIPKAIREALNIDSDSLLKVEKQGQGVYIQPVAEAVPKLKMESIYEQVLQETKGSWQGDDWPQTKQERVKIEHRVSEHRKQAW